MKKQSLCALLLLTAATGARISAQDFLILHHKSGERIGFAVEEKPSIVFKDGSVSVSGRNFSFDEIRKYTFGDASSLGVSDPETDARIVVSDDGLVTLYGVDPDVKLSVFDAKGVAVAVRVTAQGGCVTADLSSLVPGTYILSAGVNNYKINKR